MDLEIVARATGYPFDTPLESFLFAGGRCVDGPLDLDGRQPVLAIGSNAAPAQLARKFGESDATIPVTCAVLKDHVVVYSAHFTSYGSLPATLHPAAGANVFVFVTWLDDRQLERMHRSESVGVNYDYRLCPDLVLTDTVIGDRPPGVYQSRRGPLRLRSTPVRIAEIASTGAPFPCLTQRALLRHLHKRLAPAADFPAFITRIVDDAGYRREMSDRLASLD